MYVKIFFTPILCFFILLHRDSVSRMKDIDYIRKFLQDHTRKRGIQKRIAEKIGVESRYIGDLKAGRKDPSINKLQQIGGAIGASIADMIIEGGGSLRSKAPNLQDTFSNKLLLHLISL